MTGSPVSDFLSRLHAQIVPQTGGDVATYIPELAQVDPDKFGLAVAALDGVVYTAGDAEQPFTIQSVSKPFVMALAIQDRGLEGLLSVVGVEPTGDPFNAVTLEEDTGRPFNPMVNAGAIVTSALVAGDDPQQGWQRILSGLAAFAGRPLGIDERVLRSELETADRNRAIAYLMRSMGALRLGVEEALGVYCRQCSTLVTARDLAVMAATLAHGGRNPVTGEQVVRPEVVTYVLSVMLTCGLYDFSGEWMFRTGMPAKCGVGGGISVVLPGQLGIGTFSPRLDRQGNSVRGVAACEVLSRRLDLHVMRPRADATPAVHRHLHGSQVRSRRGRPARERAVLDAARAIAVIELQGVLAFKEAEFTSRLMADQTCRWLVLDAARVDLVDPVARRLLDATIRKLDVDGATVLLSGPWPPTLTAGRTHFMSASDAVEACEDTLVLEAGLPGPREAVPLTSNDLCAGMSGEDVALIESLGETLDFDRGDVIERSGTEGYALIFVIRGVIAMQSAADQKPSTASLGDALKLTSRSAGTAVSSLAFGTTNALPRLVAQTPATVTALTGEALQTVETEHPTVAVRLYRNAAVAVAAEYRWSAAENVAMSR
ncbi:glutaminase A [Georgenia thermotolerans]|uniref:Glutaminase n=1 Tax=Georgenia thermotolerans TaxID=527326 RepID=A0A7J5UL81_9MICO|nr:glutaminase A [Georgenia thermotolerans]KAE8763106.1 glutaminase A [Georgenia thermotolerans]